LKTYFYDLKEKKFKVAKPNPLSQFISAVCMWIMGGVVFCGFAIGILYLTSANPTVLALRAKNKVLRTHLKQTKVTINNFKDQIDGLAHDDNQLYRSVLGMRAISPGERAAGAGGDKIYAKFNVYGGETASILKSTSKNLAQMKRTIKIQEASFNKIRKQYNIHRKKMSHIPAIKPAKGYLSSGFGMRYHPILHHMRFHAGIDIAARVGTKVYASADGIVKQAGRDGTYGNLIIIDNGYGYETYFAHLSAILKGIKPGAKVTRGQEIGLVGQTGMATGPHVHYEVHKNGKPVNPLDYFYANTSPSQYLKYKEQAEASTKSMD
jgi:murein DD-endopeptidase MepM/ murein hydrolase activator NlpD